MHWTVELGKITKEFSIHLVCLDSTTIYMLVSTNTTFHLTNIIAYEDIPSEKGSP